VQFIVASLNYFIFFTKELKVLTKPSIRKAQQLSEGERAEKVLVFEKLLKKLSPYIEAEAARRASRLPSSYIDKEDLVAVGNIQVWVAVITWDPRRGASLEEWAKRRVWTNMNVVMGGIYQLKRVPRTIIDNVETTSRPVSLFTENGDGALLYESLEDSTYSDPASFLMENELYELVRKKLLNSDDRVAIAVLRLMVFPDEELLQLCERAVCKGRGRVRITSKSLAERLGVSTCRIATAKATIRTICKEYFECD
jgi:hypothetical protein